MGKARRGRKRKSGARHPSGQLVRPRERADEIKSVVLAYRARQVAEVDAADPMAESALGRLRLRHRRALLEAARSRRPLPVDLPGITESQHLAGEAWAELSRRHAAIMGYGLGRTCSPPLERGSRGTGGPNGSGDDRAILALRARWSEAYGALMDAGTAVETVTWSVCIDGRDPAESDLDRLRAGLEALRKVLS
jgi:hypothetical protein